MYLELVRLNLMKKCLQSTEENNYFKCAFTYHFC